MAQLAAKKDETMRYKSIIGMRASRWKRRKKTIRSITSTHSIELSAIISNP